MNKWHYHLSVSPVFFIFLLIAVYAYPAESVKDKWQTDTPAEAVELVNKGRSKGKKLHLKDAIASFEQAVKIKEDYYWGLLNLAIAYTISSGDHTIEAEALFAKAEKVAEDSGIKDPVLYDTFGQYYNKRGEYKKAIEKYQKALKIDNKYLLSVNNIGIAYEGLGEKREAILNYERAMNEGLPVAKLNYNRLIVEIRKEDQEAAYPQSYFINKNEPPDLIYTPPDTYFDNNGTAGMPTQK